MQQMVKHCCRILWKLSNQVDYHKMIFFGICLICFYNFGVCETIETIDNHRIQRRFMWKQMDNTMGGIMGGMSSSARAMKSMFGELMPTMQTTALPHMHSNILDYLPSETTRVKYIIRNPTNRKPMKIIKIRTPKKVIKIMTVPKAIVEGKPRKTRIQFPSIDELRKLEKEQEMIAEGHIPPRDDRVKESEDASMDSNDDFEDAGENNEIVSGQIHEFGDGWSPIQETVKKQSQFSTMKPHAVSKLHTRIVGSSLLSELEKEKYEPIEVDEQVDEKPQNIYEIPKNTYEVTEYTAEESVALPLTQEYRNSRGFIPYRSAQNPISVSTSPSTTTEEPNYPISFLRKYRERTAATPSHSITRFKASESAVATSWIPSSNSTFFAPKEKQPQKPSHTSAREKWPPEVPPPRPFGLMPNTENPAISTEHTTEPVRTVRKGSRLKTILSTNEDAKPGPVKQRGSVKYGDKLLLDQY